MAEPSEQQYNRAIKTDDLKPFVNYRNPQDEKIGLALQAAVKKLTDQGKPLVEDSPASVTK